MQDEIDIARQRRAQTERQDSEEQRAKSRLEDIKWLMSSPSGRRIMWALLGEAGVYRSSFTGDAGTFYREGMRSIGLSHLALVMQACPDAFIEMQKENGNG